MKILLYLFLFSINYSILFAQGQSGISGFVLDGNNNEVVNSVSVKLSSKDNTFEAKSLTDLLGHFAFKNLNIGSYQIIFSRIGYQMTIMDFSIDDIELKSIIVSLKPVEVEIEKINVTATRTEQTLQKTPSSINLISSESIQQKNKFTFDEVLQDVQGITINRTSGINVNALSIRGSSDVAGGGIGNRVLLLLDGRPS
ncbi:MAG: TonB-dependent receptor plug domain-containing protein, partial [Ignavibacteria bacterium]